MINWFGPEAWGPMCGDAPRCEPPVDTPCARCRRGIKPEDSGVTIPGGSEGPVVYHQICNLKSVLSHEEWPRVGLTPDEFDPGFQNGRFECVVCGMCWTAATGWFRRLPKGLQSG